MFYYCLVLHLCEYSVEGVAIRYGIQRPAGAGFVDANVWRCNPDGSFIPGYHGLPFEQHKWHGLIEHVPNNDSACPYPSGPYVRLAHELYIHGHRYLWGCHNGSLQRFQPLYTKRWFRNHWPVHVTRVMLRGIQLRELILHT